ncbi:MAG: hypothetical protein KDE15_02055 [Erythrobacter sp.]|nr:hypothetical protein [Erythrobacter sp.]
MPDTPISGRPLSFKIPEGTDALKARDARFWEAHKAWHDAETMFEAWPEFPDECSHAQLLLNRASELRDVMFSTPTRTGAALAIKLEVVREAGWHTMANVLPSGLTVGEMIEAGAQRITSFELFGTDAFEDMREG